MSHVTLAVQVLKVLKEKNKVKSESKKKILHLTYLLKLCHDILSNKVDGYFILSSSGNNYICMNLLKLTVINTLQILYSKKSNTFFSLITHNTRTVVKFSQTINLSTS